MSTPYIELNSLPEDGAVSVRVAGPIWLRLKDNEHPIDLTKIHIQVDDIGYVVGSPHVTVIEQKNSPYEYIISVRPHAVRYNAVVAIKVSGGNVDTSFGLLKEESSFA